MARHAAGEVYGRTTRSDAAGAPQGAEVRTVRYPCGEERMTPKERPMPPAGKPTSSEKLREVHRAQVNLVAASLRAGVQYARPGRVAKAAPKRA